MIELVEATGNLVANGEPGSGELRCWHQSIPKSLPLVLLLAGAACSRPPSHPRPPAGAPMPIEAAVNAIAAARCEHESLCNRIGPGRTHATPEACTADFASSALADLKGHPCPAGIGSNRVLACASILKRESCNPLSTLSRMYTCRPAQLCAEPDTFRESWEDIYGE